MTTTELKGILAKHGLEIDDCRQGAGKFRDLEIGCGKPHAILADCLKELKEKGARGEVTGLRIDFVNVEGHPQYGKAFLSIHSFWYEE